jgi:hypothetical protein
MEETGRFASEDGETIVFATAAALAPGDADAAKDPYVWKAGELGFVDAPLVNDVDLPTVSPGGEELAFTSPARLLPQDRDFIKDVYALRVNGGFPLPVEPTTCDPLGEGSCQGQPSESPALPLVATAGFTGPGNAKQPPRCRKGQVKRRGKCVKRKSKRKATQRKRSAKSRGAGR